MSKSKKITTPDWLTKYMDFHEQLAVPLPRFTNFITHADEPFRGLTVFLGDNNNVVIGLKRFSPEGELQIMWTSGSDLIQALMQLEDSLRIGKWRLDKRASEGYSSPT